MRAAMMIDVCSQNQWSAYRFHQFVHSAAEFEAAREVVAGKDAKTIDYASIKTMLISSWLECAVPAGNC